MINPTNYEHKKREQYGKTSKHLQRCGSINLYLQSNKVYAANLQEFRSHQKMKLTGFTDTSAAYKQDYIKIVTVNKINR